jgi:hypothetical protein
MIVYSNPMLVLKQADGGERALMGLRQRDNY